MNDDEVVDSIKFNSAIVYARKINLSKQLIRVWGVHRGQKVKLDTGYLVIEEEWFPKK